MMALTFLAGYAAGAVSVLLLAACVYAWGRDVGQAAK